MRTIVERVSIEHGCVLEREDMDLSLLELAHVVADLDASQALCASQARARET